MAELVSAFQTLVLTLRERLVDVVRVVFPAPPEELLRQLDVDQRETREDAGSRYRTICKEAESGQASVQDVLEMMFALQETLPAHVATRVYAFLSRPSCIVQMMKLMLSKDRRAPKETDARRRYPYGYVVSTVLVGGPYDLRAAAAHCDEAMNLLLNYFTQDPPLDPQITTYAARVTVSLASIYPLEVIEHMRGRKFLTNMAKHIAHSSIEEAYAQLFREIGHVETRVRASTALFDFFYEEKVYDVLAEAYKKGVLDDEEGSAKSFKSELEVQNSLTALGAIASRMAPLLEEFSVYANGPQRDAYNYMNIFANGKHMQDILNTGIHAGVMDPSSPGLGAAMSLATELLHQLRMFVKSDNGVVEFDNMDQHFMAVDGETMCGIESSLIPELNEVAAEDSKASIQQKFEDTLLSKVAELCAIMERYLATVKGPQVENERPRLGTSLLKVVEFFIACLSFGSENLRKALYQCEVHNQLYKLIEAHLENSIVHHMFEAIFEKFVMGEDEMDRIVWLGSEKIVPGLLRFWRKHAVQVHCTIAGQHATHLSTVVQCLSWVMMCRQKLYSYNKEQFNNILGQETLEQFDKFCSEDLMAIHRQQSLPLADCLPPRRPASNGFAAIRNSLGGLSRISPVEGYEDESDDEDEKADMIAKRKFVRMRGSASEPL
mmetsp:Transcript_11011/g.33767  ORF Transcript_11011/g.33767 Transcript_11011/m.33767 type:complete len:663 (-) Transcript_11011:58-2046(-)